MSELDYQELEDYTKGIAKQFEGIDEVIQELTDDQEKLQTESVDLEGVITAEALKRKATVKKDLQAVKSALVEAHAERERIRIRVTQDLSNQVSALHSKFLRQVYAALKENEEEIREHLLEAEKIANVNAKIQKKGLADFNGKVIYPINKIVQSPKGKELSPIFYLREKKTSDYLEELKKTGKAK